MNKLSIAILAATCLSLLGCDSFPESSFELASESRLPKWFTSPPGLSRPEVTVTMDYYVKSTGRTARFTLLHAGTKRRLAQIDGIEGGSNRLS